MYQRFFFTTKRTITTRTAAPHRTKIIIFLGSSLGCGSTGGFVPWVGRVTLSTVTEVCPVPSGTTGAVEVTDSEGVVGTEDADGTD